MILIRDAIIEELIVNDDTANIEMYGCKIQTVVIGSTQEDVMQENISITNISN